MWLCGGMLRLWGRCTFERYGQKSMITHEQNELLTRLRERISERMSGKRLHHTLGVEREIASLAALYAPADEYCLRKAALLHDITKELSLEKQLQLCREFGIIYTQAETKMPKTFHARTAVEVARRDFAEYADDTVLSAVRWHTTGRADMSMAEKLLYLADYIEDTRTFEDCVRLRKFFYDGLAEASDDKARAALLKATLLLSFDMTIRCLIDEGAPIHEMTVQARNALICADEVDMA